MYRMPECRGFCDIVYISLNIGFGGEFKGVSQAVIGSEGCR